jgi:hypothetical protein
VYIQHIHTHTKKREEKKKTTYLGGIPVLFFFYLFFSFLKKRNILFSVGKNKSKKIVEKKEGPQQ